MAMTEAELFEAFRTVQAEEFADVPEYVDYTFSESFEKRMDKLIRKERSMTWHFVNTRPKRIALLIAAILLLALTACSIPAVRNAIVQFFREEHEVFDDIVIIDRSVTQIEREFDFHPLPKGFTQEETTSSLHVVEKHYRNASGVELILTEIAGGTVSSGKINSFYFDVTETEVDGMNVSVYEGKDINTTIAVWMKDGYLLELYCSDNYDEDTMLRLVRSVK